MKLIAGIHVVIGIYMDPRGRVVTKVDAIV
jgi:hypothetical protein